eukprot:g8200.t1
MVEGEVARVPWHVSLSTACERDHANEIERLQEQIAAADATQHRAQRANRAAVAAKAAELEMIQASVRVAERGERRAREELQNLRARRAEQAAAAEKATKAAEAAKALETAIKERKRAIAEGKQAKAVKSSEAGKPGKAASAPGEAQGAALETGAAEGAPATGQRILGSLGDLKPMHGKICFPAVFTNKLYNMTPLFLESVRLNENARWILVHFGGSRADLASVEADWIKWPSNLQLVHTTAEEVQKLAERKWDLTFEQPLKTISGPKLNDWKAAFGVLFEDWMKDCAFWGYADLDLLYGNLDHVFHDELLDQYDIVAPKAEGLLGPLTLFRNVPKVNNLFKRDPKWKYNLNDWKDPGSFGIPGFTMYDEQGMTRLVKAAAAAKLVRVKHIPLLEAGACTSESVQIGRECHWSSVDSTIKLTGWKGGKEDGIFIHIGYAKRHTESSMTPEYLRNLIKHGFVWKRFDPWSTLVHGMRIKREPINLHNKGKSMETWTHILMNTEDKFQLPDKDRPNGCPDHATTGVLTLGQRCFCVPGWRSDGETCAKREQTGDPYQDRWQYVDEPNPFPHGAFVDERQKKASEEPGAAPDKGAAEGDAPVAGAPATGQRILGSLGDLKPMHGKICFPAVFTNKLYNMTPLFLESVRLNENARWILVHFGGSRADLASVEADWIKWPSNLQLVHTTAEEVQKLAERKWDLTFEQPLKTISGPKLNDWKAAFGVLFEDWMKDCAFWGYADLDLLYGNLDHVFHDELLDQYDIVAPKAEGLLGPLTLFRNVPKVNNLFKRDPKWKYNLNDWKDPGSFGIPGFTMYDEQGMTRLVKAAAAAKLVRVKHIPLLEAGACTSESVQIGRECHWSSVDSTIKLTGWKGGKEDGIFIHIGYAKRHTESSMTPEYLRNLIKHGFVWKR